MGDERHFAKWKTHSLCDFSQVLLSKRWRVPVIESRKKRKEKNRRQTWAGSELRALWNSNWLSLWKSKVNFITRNKFTLLDLLISLLLSFISARLNPKKNARLLKIKQSTWAVRGCVCVCVCVGGWVVLGQADTRVPGRTQMSTTLTLRIQGFSLPTGTIFSFLVMFCYR